MVKLLEETVDQSELRLTRAGTPNPELVPIVEALIQRVDSGRYTVIEVTDKKEAERTGESIRNQLKARGFRVSKVTQTKTEPMLSARGKVLKDDDNNPMTKTVFLLMMHAFSPVANPVEEEKVNGRTNGTNKVKSRKGKSSKDGAE